MQQVAYKEGSMKGNVQLCRIEETPVADRLEKGFNSFLVRKKVAYFGILGRSNFNPPIWFTLANF